jgi:hypothetical protein
LLIQVNRKNGSGQVRLAHFVPTDFQDCYLSLLVEWPKGGPGGAWFFRARLVDAAGASWYGSQISGNQDALPNPYLIFYKLGPDRLPAPSAAFDSERVTEIWFECGFSVEDTVFNIAVDAVYLGAPLFAPWSLPRMQLAAGAPQTLFAGFVASRAMSDLGALDGTVEVSYACRDYRLFTDGRTWTKDYTTLGWYDDQIIRDVLTGTGLTPSILRLGSIAHTTVLELNFEYQSVTQILDAVAKATGRVWFIDVQGLFTYGENPTIAVLELTDTAGQPSFRVESYSEDFFAPANDVTFVGDGVTAHIYDQDSIDRYGLLQWVDYDLRVTHADTALTFAQTDLARASTPNERGELVCWTVGAQPGGLVRLTAARYGWQAKEMEVQRVVLSQMPDRAATTEVRLTVGDYNPTLADAMAQIAAEVSATTAASTSGL